MTDKQSPAVIIVGAGPAGMTLAYQLARNNIAVTVLERERDFDRIFRGEALMPLGLEALDEMDINLTDVPSRLINSWDMYVANRPAFNVPEPQTELGDRAVRVVSQPGFLNRVFQLAADYPHFNLIFDAGVRDLVYENDRVIGVVAEIKGERQTLTADYIIGCDGRGSIVRSRSQIKLNLLPESYDILWFRFPGPPQFIGQTDVILLGSVKHTAICYNSFDDHMRYGLMLPKGGYVAVKSSNWSELLSEPAPSWLADHIRSLNGQIDDPMKLNVIVGRVETWHQPGVLLIGDAAHPMSPIRAQGINLALRDVIVATNHLVPALHDGRAQTLDLAAAATERERLPEIERAQALQLREAQGQMNERLRPWLIGMAKVTAPLMGRFEWAKRAWLNQQKDLRFGTAEVRLHI